MSLTIQELIKPLTPEDVRKAIYGQLARVGIDTTNWKPGAVVRTIFAVICVLFSAYSYAQSAGIKGTYLLLAKSDWLRAKAKYDYGTSYNAQTFANGNVTLTNTGAGVYDFDPGELTLTYASLQPDGSSITYYYTNQAAIHIADGYVTPTSYTVAISAELAGSGPSIPAGAVVNLSPSYTGLTVTVPTSINGSDDESDQSLINRAQAAASALSPNGPGDAYRYIALSAKRADGSIIATKCAVRPGNPVIVYVGGPSGGITGSATVFDGTSDLGLINLAVQTKVVPLGVAATVSSGAAKVIAVTYTAYCSKDTTLSSTDIQGYILDALQNYFVAFPMGGYPVAAIDGSHAVGTYWMYLDGLKAVIENCIAAIPGLVNPVYHAVVTTVVDGTPNGADDIAFNASDMAELGIITPVVLFQ